MDATPVTLGQEFGGLRRPGRRRRSTRLDGCAGPGRASCRSAAPPSGTGLNAPAGLRPRRDRPAGDAHRPAADRGAATTSRRRAPRDALVELSGQLRALAVALIKIANDLRWMGVGPAHRAGRDPPARPAARARRSCRARSTRCIPEVVTQVAAQVIGNDAAVAFAGSQGNFELNVYLPVMARNLLESIRLLANVSALLRRPLRRRASRPTRTRCRAYAESSPSIGTAAEPGPRLRGGGRAGQGVGADRPQHPRAASSSRA